jgi:hypothetical protein
MSAKDIVKAIHAARVYHGSFGKVSIKTQQRLYDRMRKAAEAVQRRTGVEDAAQQISEEAQRLGPVTPTPGRNY